MERLFLLKLILIVLISLTNEANQKNSEPLYSFQRDAVEHVPDDLNKKATIMYREEYGSRPLPLRAAVEKIPDIANQNRRLPLRDSVEKRPLPNETLYANRKNLWTPHIEQNAQPVYPLVQTNVYFQSLNNFPSSQSFPTALNSYKNILDNYPYYSSYRVSSGHQSLLGNIHSGRNINFGIDKIPNSQDYKIICYVQAVAAYRKSPLTFTADDINPNLCTHIIYAYASLDPVTFNVISNDEEYDIIQGGYKSVTGLKRFNSDLKVLLSIGGSREEASHRFSHLIASDTQHKRDFIYSVLNFINQFGFDGIEIHWNYPGTSKSAQIQSNEKENFQNFLEELSQIFKQSGLILTLSASASTNLIDNGYYPWKLNHIVDFVNVQTYDFHKTRTPIAQHHANLNTEPNGISNVDHAVKYWIEKGLSPSNVIVGIPFFGRSFTLQDINDTTIGAPIKGPGREGSYTQTPGFLAYFEICDLVMNEGWFRREDLDGSPYIANGDQWIGYEDASSIKKKLAFVKNNNLGGVSIWSSDLDDFKGFCGDKWPLSTTIYNSLKTELNVINKNEDLKLIRDDLDDKNKLKVACYVTSWAFYRKGESKFVPEHIDQRLCTHIIYAFATLNPENLILKEFDPWADIDNNLYARITSLKDSKVLLSLGGWTDSAGDKYSRLVSDGSARRRFVIGAISFLRKYGFDGLHFDWNYPICWQSNCKKGPASDKPNFTKLIQELKREFEKENIPLILASSISGYKEIIDVAYDLPSLGKSLDFMSVMTYDYHGAWEGQTGHVSPLYYQANDKYPQYNTNFTMEYLVSKGAPRHKLLVGIPFYGQTFTLSNIHNNTEGAPTIGAGEVGEYTKQPGMLAQYEICYRLKQQNWSIKRSNDGINAYASSKDQWISFEDVESINKKADYIKDRGYGGAVAWTIDLDDFTNRCCTGSFPLLRNLNRALGRISFAPINGDCTKPSTPSTPSPPETTTGVDSGASEGVHHEHHSTKWTTTTTRKTTTSPWWTAASSSTTTNKPLAQTSSPVTSTTKRTTTWWETTSKSTTKLPTTTSASTVKPTVTSENPPVPPSRKCQPGVYLADVNNCNAFYRCVSGELKKQHCASGLHWNVHSRICDWPITAKCKQSNPSVTHKPTTTTTTTTTTRATTTTHKTTKTTKYTQPTTQPTTNPTTLSHTNGDDCDTGTYYPHEECNQFYICVNHQLVAQSCPPGLNWNAEKTMCDWKYRVKCLGRKKLAEKYTQLVNSATLKPQLHSTCSGNSFAAYPGDCRQYLQCLWGAYEVFQCAPGLYWNKEMRICDWPQRSHCDESENEITTPDYFSYPTTRPSTSSPPPSRHSTTSASMKPTSTTSTASSFTEWQPSATTENSWEWHPPIPPTSEKPPLPEPLIPKSDYFKIVCYFTNWAWYRNGIGKYLPEDIDENLCTHIVYGFAVLDFSNLVIKAHDSWADFDNQFYKRVVGYKSKGIKVSIAIGGWNDSQGDKYSRLVNNPAARRRFIENILKFLDKYNFDGLDLDWEYPKCWQVDCKKGPDSDKTAFSSFVKELKEAFRPKGYLLSSAVSPSKIVIDAGYEVPVLGEYLDWVAVMTYDFHGQWDKQTGHVAPLFYHPDDEVEFFNANYSINYWISEGVPRRKIVMGMPLYGQSFRLENETNNGLNAKAPGPGEAGEYTRAAGFLAYYEICDNIKTKGWTVVQDPKRRIGPYAYKGNQWVSFDDREMIKLKSEYIRKMDLGGGMIWALDLDDFKNRCGQGRHPLLTIIRNVLAESGTGHPEPIPPINNEEELEKESPHRVGKPQSPGEKEPSHLSVQESSGSTVQSTTTTMPLIDLNSEYKVVCYFTNWAWYRQGRGKYTPSNIDHNLCTHIIYGFAVLNGDEFIIKPHDTWADFDNKFYEKVTALKAYGIKVLIAIGGWNDSAGDKYSRLVNNPSARRKFIAHVTNFIEENNFDGLDLDWEYPKCWQVDCNKGPVTDKPAFAEFVKELHEAFKPKGWLLSAAVSPSKRVIDSGYNVRVLSKYLSWIAVMTYDFHGQWDKITGHVAPMYSHPEDIDATFNTNFTIHYWIQKGADRKKIVLGMPMYGQSFSLADNNQHGLNAATYGGGEAGEDTRARGFLAYYEICTNIIKKEWKIVRDRKGRMGPYAYLRDQWVSFDDIGMIRHKSEYIKAMGLGGGMIWALDLDDFKNECGCEEYPLLRTINRVLRNYSIPDPKCILGKVESKPTTKPASSTSTTLMATTLSTTISTTVTPRPQKCDGNVFKPHSENCNQYYLCNQGEYSLQTCADGLYWNNDHCDWPENSPCHPDGTTTESSSTTSVKPIESTEGSIDLATTKEPELTISSEYKVVCYFTNWAWYRQGQGKYFPSDIDTSLCTHINYGFAVLDTNTLLIKPHDSWADIDNEFYSQVVAYKSKGIKVLIAIGGWNDSAGNKYSRLVSNSQSRSKFIKNVIEFIEKWGFDGLDLDWEYPKCWQVDCGKGPTSDKENFAALVQELSNAFKPKGLLLSSAVSPSKAVIDAGYDVPILNQYFDWIAIMTYDFHGHWDKQTGHVAPLYHHPEDIYDNFNANFSIHYWLEKGADRRKLVMGMPLYGQSFSLADSSKNGLNEKSYGPGEAGEFTRAGGFLAFYEICNKVINGGWKVKRDPLNRIGPYAFMGNQWVSYDDISDIKRKAQLIKSLNLGGGMIWALDLDDFRNTCGCGKHPLLKKLNSELRNFPSDISVENCT